MTLECEYVEELLLLCLIQLFDIILLICLIIYIETVENTEYPKEDLFKKTTEMILKLYYKSELVFELN